ncbi:MAG: hypothetical protein CMD70_06425 [Gammaproteobacteria bacterium]|jgi:hypothetical protein|nr:hypothetical protein [Gammaproteobacteria bacterium]
MRNLIRIDFLVGVAAFVASNLSLAHHSHSMFDHSEEVSISGTVTKFSFRNPHVFLFIDVKNENGEVLNYWIEMSNIPNMIRRGVGYKTFAPGDEVTVNMWRLKDGRPGGNYTTIVAADGKTYD